MLRVSVGGLLLCSSLLSCRSSRSIDPSSPESLVNAYVQAQQATMQAGAGEAEVEALLAFLSDSFVYEHPRAHATIAGKAAYAEGLRHFLGSTRRTQIRVVSTLVNGGVVVTNQTLSFQVEREGAWQDDGRSQVTVFDVEGGRIARIVDFWQPREGAGP